MRTAALLLIALALLGGCGEKYPPVNGCVPAGGLEPTCSFSNPEDIELLPDGRTLLISQMGSLHGDRPGSFALFDTKSQTITRLPQFGASAGPPWGDASCTTPPGPAFSPHGIDLGRRADGQWQLLAVNHGGRESVEFFQLLEESEGYRLAWRGCALPPPDSHMNDVAALPAGGFVATHMYPRGSPSIGPFNLDLLKGMLGFDTGYVLHWDGERFEVAAGTRAPYPNGIQVSPDGKTLFVNAYLAGEVRKIAFPGGELLGKARVKGPDNSQWDAEGRLLVASHTAGLVELGACFGITEGACGAAFAIVAVDPGSMEAQTILEHRGAPMGAATVAQQVGDELYLGSFAGDRIVRAPMPAPAR